MHTTSVIIITTNRGEAYNQAKLLEYFSDCNIPSNILMQYLLLYLDDCNNTLDRKNKKFHTDSFQFLVISIKQAVFGETSVIISKKSY